MMCDAAFIQRNLSEGVLKMSRSKAWVPALTLYVVLITGLAFGLWRARQWATAQLVSTTAQENWEDFREDIREQAAQGGPVKRRVPASAEPPLLVLMRDHFTPCATIALVLSSALYATLAFFLVGALSEPNSNHE